MAESRPLVGCSWRCSSHRPMWFITLTMLEPILSETSMSRAATCLFHKIPLSHFVPSTIEGRNIPPINHEQFPKPELRQMADVESSNQPLQKPKVRKLNQPVTASKRSEKLPIAYLLNHCNKRSICLESFHLPASTLSFAERV